MTDKNKIRVMGLMCMFVCGFLLSELYVNHKKDELISLYRVYFNALQAEVEAIEQDNKCLILPPPLSGRELHAKAIL